mgnify:CR=1 FL=1
MAFGAYATKLFYLIRRRCVGFLAVVLKMESGHTYVRPHPDDRLQRRFFVVVEGARSSWKIGVFEKRTSFATCPTDGLVVRGVPLAFGSAVSVRACR